MKSGSALRNASTALSGPRGVGVSLQRISRIFPGGVEAIAGIDLEVPAGQFLAILGPSGCGKSTLLRIIAGLDEPSAGVVHVDRKSIAYVFQDAHLLPWRDVLHNVALPLELMGVARDARLDAAHKMIEQVGLSDATGRYPAQLSGGMRMRVSLARALVTDPELLLLDEPFAALDEITRQQLDEEIHRLWWERRKTVIFVTHSIVEATFLAQRAIMLSRRPARMVIDHTLDLPPTRSAELRTDPKFSTEMRVLFDALDDGGEV
jgi:NitT/TauT family transport system ATP-binding protein